MGDKKPTQKKAGGGKPGKVTPDAAARVGRCPCPARARGNVAQKVGTGFALLEHAAPLRCDSPPHAAPQHPAYVLPCEQEIRR